MLVECTCNGAQVLKDLKHLELHIEGIRLSLMNKTVLKGSYFQLCPLGSVT